MLEVLHGTTSRLAEAVLPVTIIRRWWAITALGSLIIRQFSASKSGDPSHGDQLTLMAMISPSRAERASTNSGSSPATDAVCGHHAPSRDDPNSNANESLTGLAKRRPRTFPFMVLTMSRVQLRHTQEHPIARLSLSRLGRMNPAPAQDNPTTTLGDP